MKDQRSRVGSGAAIVSSYYSPAGLGEPGHPDDAPTAGGDTYTQSKHRATLLLTPFYPLCLPTLNCFTAFFSHWISLLLEGETYCYQTPSPCGGSDSFPSPVKYAGFPTPLLGAIPSQITLSLKP